MSYMKDLRMVFFNFSSRIASLFSKRWKNVVIWAPTSLLIVYILYTYHLPLYKETYQSLTRIPYLTELILVIRVLVLTFVVIVGISRVFYFLVDISADNIFGRFWQSTYVNSIVVNNYRIFTQSNRRKFRGLLSRWHKNMHEHIHLHFSTVLVLLLLSIPIIGFFSIPIYSGTNSY